MTRLKSGLHLVVASVLVITGCSNVFAPSANKVSDEALYEDALKLMDAGSFTASVAKFNALGTGFAASSSVKENWAGALAGECGLKFIDFTQQLSAASLSGTTFFKYLMNAWTGVAVVPGSCTLAELKIKEIWKTQAPTASQQFFMAILSLAKMGAYVRQKADNDAAGVGNGTVDATFDSCSTTDPGAHNLTDPEGKELVTGFSLFLQNIVGFSGSLSADLGTQITAFNTLCAALDTDPSPTVDTSPCGTTDAVNVTPAMVKAIRYLLKSNSAGLESCPAVAPLPGPTCCP